MRGGELQYKEFGGEQIRVDDGRYHGEAKFMSFTVYQQLFTRLIDFDRSPEIYVQCMIPNGNVWNYPLLSITFPPNSNHA